MVRTAALAAVVALSSGCITLMGEIKHQQDVSVANIIEAGAADLVLTTFFMFSAESLSGAASIASGVGFTALDLGVGCLLGTCQALHP